jgi:DNA-binding transcriptional ArsR family regulator
MVSGTHMAEVAALVGDPTRASMLAIMMDGRAHTASELAAAADISAATASGHLGKLLGQRLVAVAARGRYRYYRLASLDVARMLEGIMVVSAEPRSSRHAVSRVPAELQEARTCYDHVAGRLGVAIADTLIGPETLLSSQGECELTERGRMLLAKLNVNLDAIRGRSRRILCRPCLDWSERRPHLAGIVGTAVLERLLELGWIKRVGVSRELRISPAGTRELWRYFHYKRRDVG